jgi:hypothetical protein
VIETAKLSSCVPSVWQDKGLASPVITVLPKPTNNTEPAGSYSNATPPPPPPGKVCAAVGDVCGGILIYYTHYVMLYSSYTIYRVC